MSTNAKAQLSYAEFLFSNAALASNEIFASEVNYRAIISRAYYSAYLTANKYIKNIENTLLENPLKEIKIEKLPNSFTITLLGVDYKINIDATKIKRKIKSYANSHQNVIKYFAKNGKTTIANGLRSLKIEREKADYKLDLNIDYRIAKSSCGKARSIIKAIEKLQNDS